jgi:hypothetical protein
MSRLDDYRSALLAANTDVSAGVLERALDDSGPEFVTFVVDHGLGPLWHARTGRDEFHSSRLSAEALFLAQQHALGEIDTVLEEAEIDYAVIKGAAIRLLLNENPAIRACHDLDLLVRPEDRVRAASALVNVGFAAKPDSRSIDRELILSPGLVDVDLHWGLLREGRLRRDFTADMLDRRRQSGGLWMLNPEDSFFLLLVHPAFAKHLAGWEMGLHRVADIVVWLRTQSHDWQIVHTLLEQNGVQTAAWATLRWVQLLTSGSGVMWERLQPRSLAAMNKMMSELRPGRLRQAWLDRWLRNDLSERASAAAHWSRLLGFSLFLHDTPADVLRALAGWYRAHRRRSADLEAFRKLTGEQIAFHQVGCERD